MVSVSKYLKDTEDTAPHVYISKVSSPTLGIGSLLSSEDESCPCKGEHTCLPSEVKGSALDEGRSNGGMQHTGEI